MTATGLKETDDAYVPVLDLESGEESVLASRLDQAFRDSGFAIVIGHGIDDSLVDRFHSALLRFFHLPSDGKARYASTRPGDFGWVNRSDVGGGGQPELCEVYTAGPWGEPGAPVEGMSEEARAMTVGNNKWPAEVPELRDAWLDYYEAAERPADLLLRLAATALGEPDDAFARHHRNPISPMIANWYPPQPIPPAPGQIRKGDHSDWGSLTLLWHDGTPGLQLLAGDGTWFALNPPPGSLVINIGDLMARWTNDRWKATVHRVVNPKAAYTARERVSIPWFGQPDYDALIEVLPSCIPAGEEPKYEPVLCGDWYSAKLKSVYET